MDPLHIVIKMFWGLATTRNDITFYYRIKGVYKC